MYVNQHNKALLEKFISNPCDPTLEEFAYSSGNCLLHGLIPEFDYQKQHCPRMCKSLADERKEMVQCFGCSSGFLVDAWQANPGGILLNLIKLNAYVGSIEKEVQISRPIAYLSAQRKERRRL